MASAANAAEARDRLEALCWTYRLALPPRLLPPEERANLLVSSCVLSQVSWPQRVYARRVYERRFSSLPGPLERRWARHFTYLELRLQQDHLTSLAGVAEQVALTCDVVNNATVLDAAGTERKSGQTSSPLGVPSLLERVPKLFQIEGHAAGSGAATGHSHRQGARAWTSRARASPSRDANSAEPRAGISGIALLVLSAAVG